MRECIICHYWCFLEIKAKFQLKVCDGYHDLTLKSKNFNDVAIVSVRRYDYGIHFWYMNKDKVIDLLRNADSAEKTETL